MENTIIRGSVYDQIKAPAFSPEVTVAASASAPNYAPLLIAIAVGAVIVYLIYVNSDRHTNFLSPEQDDR